MSLIYAYTCEAVSASRQWTRPAPRKVLSRPWHPSLPLIPSPEASVLEVAEVTEAGGGDPSEYMYLLPRWRLDACSQLQHRQVWVSSFIPSLSSPFPAWCLSSDGVERCPECSEKKSRTRSSSWMVKGPSRPASHHSHPGLPALCLSLSSWLCPKPCHPEKSAGAAVPTGKRLPSEGVSSTVPVTFTLQLKFTLSKCRTDHRHP